VVASPIVYRGEPAFRDLLLELADQVAEPELIARHYAHLGRLQWQRLASPDPETPVRLKGIFYCLRPAAAVRWMRTHPGHAVPPMRLHSLLGESDAPTDVMEAAAELVALKSRTRELGIGRFPSVLRAFVVTELATLDLSGTAYRRHDPEHSRIIASETFRTALSRFAAPPPRVSDDE
jgi:predicted nucleotidyltransferase